MCQAMANSVRGHALRPEALGRRATADYRSEIAAAISDAAALASAKSMSVFGS